MSSDMKSKKGGSEKLRKLPSRKIVVQVLAIVAVLLVEALFCGFFTTELVFLGQYEVEIRMIIILVILCRCFLSITQPKWLLRER